MKKKNGNHQLVDDDRWKMKGRAHKQKRFEPVICPQCGGAKGWYDGNEFVECPKCLGEGELYQ